MQPNCPPKQNPRLTSGGFGEEVPGGDLLLHGLSHTTIGAGAFHCRVRDGIGWYHTAMAAREGMGKRDGVESGAVPSMGDLGRKGVWAEPDVRSRLAGLESLECP